VIRYLLDTNICVEIIRGRGTAILKRLQQCAVGEVGISVITLAELEYGAEKSARPEQNRLALHEFCAPLELLPFDDAAAIAYGKIRAALNRAGQMIGPMDLLIAAHALAQGIIVVTNNEKEFRRVDGLDVENWMLE
jgi:tRNA(fMet)-specific endonuclease VapC